MSEVPQSAEFDLDNIILKEEDITFEDLREDRYSFIVPDLKTARMIGYAVGRGIGVEDFMLDQLRNPAPTGDFRLDSVDTSYTEKKTEDDKYEVQIFLRQYVGKEPYSSQLRNAVDTLFDKNEDQ